MRFRHIFLIMLLTCCCTTSPQKTNHSNPSVTPKQNTFFYGLCYSPFRDGHSPESGKFPQQKEIKQDIYFINHLTRTIRTYGCGNKSLSMIPSLCQKVGIDCYPGAWIGRDEKSNEIEIKALLKIASQNLDSVKGIIIGNEVILRKDQSELQLIRDIKKVKKATRIPVGTAEEWSRLLKLPRVAQEADFLLVHIHPYHDGVAIKDAANYVVKRYKQLKRTYPHTRIIIGETGWPTKGDRKGAAIPSERNQKIFVESFKKLAKEKKIPYFYFSLFDEDWKGKYGIAEKSWGIFYSEGSIKPFIKTLVPSEAEKGIQRGKSQKIKLH